MRENISLLKSVVDRLKGPCYLSRDEHECKIRARKQRTDNDVYCFLNRTLTPGNQMPAEDLVNQPCKSHIVKSGKIEGILKCEEQNSKCGGK
jgi:hypothetical protein